MDLNNIRYYAFWLIDSLKGFKVKKHLNEIEHIQLDFSSKKSKQLRSTYLKDILEHASTTTEFYRPFINQNLNKYPIINKNIIRNNKKQFISKNFENKRKKNVSSSGSTGTTISIFHDANKSYRSNADNIYFHRLTGFKIGDKLIYIRIFWFPISKITMWLKNIEPIEILNLNNQSYILKLVKNLASKKGSKNIIGYASALEKICVFLDQNKYKPFVNSKIKSVIAISESLNLYTKEKIMYYFNTRVYSRYSNSENGILAQQTSYSGNDFVINWASYFIEILKLNEDTPASSGEVGRIVITDFFNFSMPMIRYDTGDVGSIDYTVTPPVFKSIEGRKSDIIYNTKGEIVSSLIIVRPHLCPGVIQSQLIQQDQNAYTIKLNVSEEFNHEQIIIEEFKKILGKDALITVKYISEIPPLASGKTRATINNYKLKNIEVKE